MATLDQKMEACRLDLEMLAQGWRPSVVDLELSVRLTAWWPMTHRTLNLPALAGDAADHPHLGSDLITTSPVMWVAPDLSSARCLSRWYRLGRPRDEPMGIVPVATWEQVGEMRRRWEAARAFEIGNYRKPRKDRT